MCGILGWVHPNSVEKPRLQRALDSLSHRGPDDEGLYLDPEHGVALGHRRLSIIDLSPAGRQPMTNEDGTLFITYNGEIYNHPELREELIAKGHRFRSRTDSEVLVHLYEEEGEELVHRLIGMFAFALYDRKRGRILLVRDRLGIKPLYYAQYNGAFLFASEIKAILATGELPVDVDWQGIWDYFTFLFVPYPRTAFQGIQSLPPATLLTYDLASRRIAQRRYWTPWQHGVHPDHAPSRERLKNQLRELLTDAVRGELISDVSLGVFFSGGIDSTLLAALMARCAKERIKTFTVGFQGPHLGNGGDLPYARLASRRLGTEHHELIVDLKGAEDLVSLIRCFDQPFANPTFYLQYLIAKQTKRFVTVALSGVGGDELFGGYPKYRLFPWAGLLGRLPAGSGRAARHLLAPLREGTWGPLLRRARRTLKGVGFSLPEQYVRWSYYLTEEEKHDLLNPAVCLGSPAPSPRLLEEAFATLPPEVDLYGKLFYAELQTFLAGNLLEYTDKMTMAVSLETRVPFLDHRLVELSAQIPFREKIRWGKPKAILLETFRDLLPPEIVGLAKRGFAPPIAQWMTAVLDRYFDQVMTQRVVEKEGIFRWEAIRRLRMEHKGQLRDASMELLGILIFDVWFRQYILKQPVGMEALG